MCETFELLIFDTYQDKKKEAYTEELLSVLNMNNTRLCTKKNGRKCVSVELSLQAARTNIQCSQCNQKLI